MTMMRTMAHKEKNVPFSNLRMEQSIRDNGMSIQIKGMEEVYKSGSMVVVMKAIGEEIKQMEEVA